MTLPEDEKTLAALGAFTYGVLQGFIYDGATTEQTVGTLLMGTSMLKVDIDNHG